MFWGLVVHHDKQYSHTVDVRFHISMAVLEKKTGGTGATDLMVKVNGETYVLCRLSESHSQQQLDLNFTEGEDVVFYVNGTGNVHLSGYNLEEDMDLDDEEEDTESEDEKVETPKSDTKKRKLEKEKPSLVPSPQSAKKMKTEKSETPQSAKKAKAEKNAPKKQEINLSLMGDAEDSDEDVSDLELSDLDEEEESDEDYEDVEEEEMGEEEEESEDSEDEEPVKNVKTPQKKVQTPVPGSGKGSPKKQLQTPVSSASAKKTKTHVATPFPGKEKQPDTPMSNGTQSEKKKKKKKNKKKENKENPGDQQKTPKKTIKGGIMLEDMKPGTGPEVGKGKWVHIYYEGKLKGSNKAFDSNKEGKGFKFKLGAGEVIKGLECGLDGMKVGGRRKLTIPPKMGYGTQGAGKDIPPNSTLEFDVELKAVN